MTSQGRSKEARGAVAGVHESGDSVCVVVLSPQDGAHSVSQSRTMTRSEAESVLPGLLSGVTRVVRVTPLRETICRVTTLPLAGTADNDDQTAGAVSLLGEAELPAVAPAHRRGSGVVGLPMADGARHVLVTAWTGAARDPLGDIDEVWATPVAALAALWAGKGEQAVYVGEREGGVAVLVQSPSRLVARVVPTEVGPAAGEEAEQVLRETCAAAEAEEPGRLPGGRALVLSDAARAGLRAKVRGVRDEVAWMDAHGLALGAALLALEPRRSVSALAALRSVPPREKLSIPARIGTALTNPRTAWLTAGAAVVLLLGAPIALAAGRAAILGARVREIESRVGGQKELEDRAALYQQLEGSRWPLTKLLNDLSTLAPVGVTVSSMRVNAGQDVNLRGTAKSQELVTRFGAALVDSKVFSKSTINRTEFKDGGVDFDMTLQVGQPFARVPVSKDPDAAKNTDYAALPLARRLYGEGASNDSVASADRPSRSRRGGATSGSPGGSASGSPTAAATERRPSPSEVVPPPVSDADIAKMDRATAMSEWVKRKTYPQKNPKLDAVTKQRLEEEWPKIKARFDQLKSTEGGGS
ncbi:MAG: hypothetical protein DYG92_04685 [Leptolyngbya sp. PLA1]|nr:hypothetical protein [Leptolyngbya sp. PLA1]